MIPGASSHSGLSLVAPFDEPMGPPTLPPKGLEERTAPVRTLVSEDGSDPRMLITAHLRRAGAAVDTVRNASAAVSAVLGAVRVGRPYAVAFLQLRRDAFAASERLRRLGYRGSLVALTESPTPELRAQCSAAGCNGYLAEPIRMTALRAVLETCTGAIRPSAWMGEPEGSITSELADDPEIADLIVKFVRLLPDRVDAFRIAMNEQDLQGVRRLAHQMSGGAACYGFPGLSAVAGMLENSIVRPASCAAGDIELLVDNLVATAGHVRL